MPLSRFKDTSEQARAVTGMVALALVNPFFFALRSLIRFHREGYAESAQDPTDPLPENLVRTVAGDRARELESRYRFRPSLHEQLTPASWLLTLYYTDLLDVALCRANFAASSLARLEGGTYAPIDTLDIGAKNFISAIALQHVLEPPPSHASPPPRGALLTGVEIDGWRILRGWHSRRDMAQYYLGLLPPSPSARAHEFLTLNFMRLAGQYDFISWFHPFLDAYPLLHWGLPRRLLKPEAMFKHMLARLRPGGIALIVNQAPHEDEAQRALIAAAGPAIARHVAFEHASPFSRRTAPGYLHVLRKAPA